MSNQSKKIGPFSARRETRCVAAAAPSSGRNPKKAEEVIAPVHASKSCTAVTRRAPSASAGRFHRVDSNDDRWEVDTTQDERRRRAKRPALLEPRRWNTYNRPHG
jgi:hypothetical protein